MTTFAIMPLQAAGAPAAGGGQLGFWVMIIALFAIMYFFMIRPQRKKQKEIEKFRNALHIGQEVITAGGIHGTIRKIDEATNIVTLEIAREINIRIDKACIYANAASAEQQADRK
jgi:preprotein translocase subunit YajC